MRHLFLTTIESIDKMAMPTLAPMRVGQGPLKYNKSACLPQATQNETDRPNELSVPETNRYHQRKEMLVHLI